MRLKIVFWTTSQSSIRFLLQSIMHRVHFECAAKYTESVTGLQAMYFRYCYELHILVKNPTSVKRVSFLLKEDITKLDRLDAQTRLLAKKPYLYR